MNIEDLFKTENALSGITDADYMSAMHLIENAEVYCRLSCQAVYVVDLYKKKILCAYGDLTQMCGLSHEDLIKEGLGIYINHIPHKDLTMLRDINDMASSFCHALPKAEQMQYTVHCDFHFTNGCRSRLVHHQATPLLTRKGKPWIIMCTVSLPSNESAGNLCVKMHRTRIIYKCTIESRSWEKHELPSLRALEGEVIALSAQGKTMREIAKELCKSEDTIKACKRELFKKLGTANIQQTIQFVQIYKLI